MRKFYYGGQAVVEGVMMRGQRLAAVAVRRPDGSIALHSEELPRGLYGRRAARLPFLRGFVAIWEMLVLGMRMLLYSVKVGTNREKEDLPRQVLVMMMIFSLTFVIGVFFVLPLLVARAGGHIVHGSLGANLLEGVVRLILFVLYLALVGQMSQMRRVFQYHGAEHKAVNAYEHGSELTPAAVQRFSTIHVRCGTAFLLWVVVISILVFALLGHPPILLGAAERIVLVPLIAAFSYEILRLGARYYHVPIVRLLVQPGLWLQRLTTRQPSDDQVEVAIAALVPVLAADGAPQPAGALRPAAVPSHVTP